MNQAQIQTQNQEELNNLLLEACKDKNLKAVKNLIKKGVGVNIKDKNKNTPLHYACSSKFIALVRLLVSHGAKLEAKNDKGETALFIACATELYQTVNFLIEQGANIKVKDKKNRTLLFLLYQNSGAYPYDRQDLLCLLFKKGIDVNAQDISGSTILHYVYKHGHRIDAEQLIKKGANVKVQNQDNKTCVQQASRSMLTYINSLIERVFYFASDDSLTSAKHYLSRYRSLMGKDLDLNSHRTERKRMLLQDVAQYNNPKTIEFLLKHGADINATGSSYQHTPLHIAVYKQQYQNVRILLQHKANVHAKNFYDETALYHACYAGYPQIVRILLEYGGNLYDQNRGGETCFDVATPEVKEYLNSLKALKN